MPHFSHRIVRRGLLAAGGTLLAGAVAGKYLRPASAGVPAEAGLQPVSALQARAPAAVPPLHFTRADGGIEALSDHAGFGVVLNFWATWCVPCVAEMPALDSLARALKGQRIVVLAVSEDHGGAASVTPFYVARGISSLPVLSDPQSQAMSELRLDGVPTTLVIDRQGRAVARIEGAVQWDAPDAAARIGRLVG